MATDPGIFEHMTVLSDTVRGRLLLLVEERELTVSDLCSVTQLPQSTVSRQLKTLVDAGWLTTRPDGTRRLYRVSDSLDPRANQLWELTRVEIEASPAHKSDRKRLRSVLSRQKSRSQRFFETSGDQWDALRDEMFGAKFYLYGLMGLVPGDWRVADLGCGTGTVVEALAPFAKDVVGVDGAPGMLDEARQRLARFDNVSLRQGDLAEPPLEDEAFDVATMILVLHHVEDPGTAVREAARCLRPGGNILIVDMLPHDRTGYQHDMGHVWLGFSKETISGFLEEAGFEPARFVELPPAPEAMGPNLFAVSAGKKE